MPFSLLVELNLLALLQHMQMHPVRRVPLPFSLPALPMLSAAHQRPLVLLRIILLTTRYPGLNRRSSRRLVLPGLLTAWPYKASFRLFYVPFRSLASNQDCFELCLTSQMTCYFDHY